MKFSPNVYIKVSLHLHDTIFEKIHELFTDIFNYFFYKY